MRALEFTNNLKNALFEVASNPDNHILFSDNDLSLFKKVKSFSLQFLKENEDLINGAEHKNFLVDLLNRNNFKTRIKYATVKLNEYGITKNEYYFYISEGIKHFLEEKDNYLTKIFHRDNKLKTQDLVIMEISNCFRDWYFPRDEYYIKFLEERQLIHRNSLKRSWTISNLGNYFIRLSTFDSVAFLCGIEVAINNDKGYSRFINLEAINYLLNSKEDENKHQYSNISSYTLKALGIIENIYSNSKVITSFGEKVLDKVKKNIEDYNSLVLFLLESEASGINFFEFGIEPDYNKDWYESSTILNSDQKKSVNNSVAHYKNKDYLDSIRVLYPLLEGTLDSALIKINFAPTNLNGMNNKVDKLRKEKIVSLQSSLGLQMLYESRNKILHGNFIEDDPETIKPLFSLVLSYLKKIIREIEFNLERLNLT